MRPLSWLLALCMLATPGLVAAHAVLTGTSIEGDRIPAGAETTVVLRFNSAIEPALSCVALVDAQKAERVLALHPGAEPGRVEVTVPALTPGAYGLHYKIFAVDGHVTENVVRFTAAPAD
ncbi:MAG: copper resistance protein CopC [bacterium]|nr:copper resistance protein CopC [bacterium]